MGLIAILRKVITLDVKALAAPTLFAVAALVPAIAASYWLVRRAVRGTSSEEPAAKG